MDMVLIKLLEHFIYLYVLIERALAHETAISQVFPSFFPLHHCIKKYLDLIIRKASLGWKEQVVDSFLL